MRVLQLITDTERRGAQVFATELHRSLRRRRQDVRTVALEPGTRPELDVPVLGASSRRPSTLRRLRTEASRVDVVVAHGSSTLPAASVAMLGLPTPFVYRQISDSLFWANTRPRRLRVRGELHRARLVVALWEGAARVLREHFGVREAKLRIVPNGVRVSAWRPATEDQRRDARLELGLRPDVPVVVFVGALTLEKGTDLAVEAVGRLDEAQLVVVGSGPEEQRIRELINARLPARAVMLASTSRLLGIYAAADVLICPSRSESMPAVVIEAGLCGVPVVATAVGGLAHMIEPGRTGELVPEGSISALATAVRSLLEDPVAARAMGDRARTWCLRHYDIDVVGDAWCRVLAEAVGADARNGSQTAS
jgi:glycosyltransferase involved in cell wall biosynthesis